MNKSTTLISASELAIICAIARLSIDKTQEVFEGTPLIFGGVEYKYHSCGATAAPLDGTSYKSPLGDMFA